MELTPPEVLRMQRLIVQIVGARFVGHPDLEDIAQECVLSAWQVIERAEPMPIDRAMAWAKRAALWQLSEWYRDRRNGQRRHTRRGVELPSVVSLEELTEEEAVDWQGALLAAAEADRLVAQLVDAGVISASAWELLLRCVMGNESLEELADEWGVSCKAVQRLRESALARLKAEATSQGQQREATALFLSWSS